MRLFVNNNLERDDKNEKQIDYDRTDIPNSTTISYWQQQTNIYTHTHTGKTIFYTRYCIFFSNVFNLATGYGNMYRNGLFIKDGTSLQRKYDIYREKVLLRLKNSLSLNCV